MDISDIELHLLIQSKCKRVPINDTEEEMKNPSGILYCEYKKVKEELLNTKNYVVQSSNLARCSGTNDN